MPIYRTMLAVPRRVLIVEDDFLIAMELALVLEELGHEVCGRAADAAGAVAEAGRLQPDLVLMDIRLAGSSDGIDAAAEILRRHGIRSLFVSGNVGDRMTLERLRPLHPLGYLDKPVDPERLRDLLRGAKEPS